MESDLALETLLIRERAKIFHTIHSEQGHALERKDLQSTSGPGKSFVHHVRRNVLVQARALHIENGGQNPAKLSMKPSEPRPVAKDPFAKMIPDASLKQLGDLQSPELKLADFQLVGFRRQLALVAPDGPMQIAPLVALPAQALGPLGVAPPPGAQGRAGVGGSIFIVILNYKRKAAKLANGGRTLNPEQLALTLADATTEADEARREGGPRWELWKNLYRSGAWRQESDDGHSVQFRHQACASRQLEYHPHFGILGTQRLPLQPEAILNEPRPTSDRVYRNSEYIIYPENVVHPLRGHAEGTFIFESLVIRSSLAMPWKSYNHGFASTGGRVIRAHLFRMQAGQISHQILSVSVGQHRFV